MSTSLRPAVSRWLSLAAAVLALGSCESPAAPSESSDELQIGVVNQKTLWASDSVHDYKFVTEPGAVYVVYATVAHPWLSLTLRDSTGSGILAYAFAVPGNAVLAASPVIWLDPGAGGTRILTVRRDSAVDPVTFKILINRINEAPENRPAAFTIGDTVSGETLDPAQDIDVFTADLLAGQDFVVVAEAPTVAGAGPVELAVQDPSGTAFSITDYPTGVPAAATTGRLHANTTGTYKFRFVSAGAFSTTGHPFQGAYRFWTYPINRAPEHRSAVVVPGDTISGESIDILGDLDEFTFAASAGEDFYAFLQAGPGGPTTQLRLDAVDPGDSVLTSTLSMSTDPTLFGQVTTVIHAQTTGQYRLRVGGAAAGGGTSTGPYRLFLYRVNRQPETAAPLLALGDSLFTESLDMPGDVDEFRVHVAAPTGANFFAAYSGAGQLLADIVDSVTGQVVGVAGSAGNGAAGESGALALKAGTYLVRVHEYAWDGRPHQRGSYGLWLFNFGFGPETVNDTIVIGDTVQGEAIEVPGDQDTFRFFASSGQHINVMVQGLGPAPAFSGVTAFINGPAAGTQPFATVFGGTAAASLADHQTNRLDIFATGWYTMTISSGLSGHALGDRGAYRLAVVPVGTAPESHAAALAIGDSVTPETINTRGDWDQFTVTATPGQELYALFGTAGVTAMASDPATGDTLALNGAQGTRILGPFTVPATGVTAVSVFEWPSVTFRQCSDATCNGVYSYTGPYSLKLLALNRAPESAPAAYTIGDTVSSEDLFPAGDIDEFTTTATPGDTLTMWFRLRSGIVPAGGALTIYAFDATAGSVPPPLAGFFGLTFNQVQTIIVPPSGQLRIRVLGYGLDGTGIETAPYEFFLKRGT